MTLNELKAQQSGRVVAVHGCDSVSQRLMEMGLFAGADVKVVRLAPLGDPMELLLHGYHLSLRKSEAALIQIEPCP